MNPPPVLGFMHALLAFHKGLFRIGAGRWVPLVPFAGQCIGEVDHEAS